MRGTVDALLDLLRGEDEELLGMTVLLALTGGNDLPTAVARLEDVLDVLPPGRQMRAGNRATREEHIAFCAQEIGQQVLGYLRTVQGLDRSPAAFNGSTAQSAAGIAPGERDA